MALLPRGDAAAGRGGGDLRAGSGQRRFHLGCSVKQKRGEYAGLQGGHESWRPRRPGWCPPELRLCGIWEVLALSLSVSFYLLPEA